MNKFSLKSMWNNECPRCRKAKLYKEPFEFSKPIAMHDACPVCGQKTEPEPGFYYGAMFLSYIFSGWFYILPALLLVFYFKWSVEAAMLFVIAMAALTYIKLLRGSRMLWLHMNVKYNPSIAQEVNS